MKRILKLLPFFLILIFTTKVKAQYLIESELLSSTPAFLLGFIPQIPAEYDVKFYRLTYNTVDTHGDPTIASGAVGIPNTTECNTFPMAVYCHGTVLKQLDVPSEENSEGLITKIFASTGFIAVAPDYLGLGQGTGIHPYVHAQSEATASIDLIRATREFLETIPVSDNGEVFVTGYSQGGQGAMATLEYAEENNLNDELGITAGAPCSGPYNLSGSQATVLLSDQPYSNPGYVIYLLMSYQLAYGNLYNQLSDIIQQPYADQVAPYFDGMQNTYDMGTVNAILPGQLSDLLVDSVYTNFQTNPNHPLWEDLRANDTYNWTPQVPLRMYYCTGDEQVDYHNSLTADSAMHANGATNVAAYNVLSGGSHGDCVLPALTQVYLFFDSLATSCSLSTDIVESRLKELKIYPNPATDFINISLPESKGYMIVQDTYGRVVLEKRIVQQDTRLDISKLAAATYVISLQANDIIRRATLVVVR